MRLSPLPFALLLAACSTSSPSNSTIASGTIGPAGGMVQGGGVTIRVPAGALTADTTLTVEKLEGSLTAPQPGLSVLTTYRLGPRTTFAKPVALAFPIDPAKLPAEATASGSALVLVHAADDGGDPQIVGSWVGGETTIAGLTSSFSLFEVAVLSTDGVGRCSVTAAVDVSCTSELACDDQGVCSGACNVTVGKAGHELACSSGGATTVTCTCHGPSATSGDAFALPPFLGPNPRVRLVWELLRHCDYPCPDGGASDAPTTDAARDAAPGDVSPLF